MTSELWIRQQCPKDFFIQQWNHQFLAVLSNLPKTSSNAMVKSVGKRLSGNKTDMYLFYSIVKVFQEYKHLAVYIQEERWDELIEVMKAIRSLFVERRLFNFILDEWKQLNDDELKASLLKSFKWALDKTLVYDGHSTETDTIYFRIRSPPNLPLTIEDTKEVVNDWNVALRQIVIIASHVNLLNTSQRSLDYFPLLFHDGSWDPSIFLFAFSWVFQFIPPHLQIEIRTIRDYITFSKEIGIPSSTLPWNELFFERLDEELKGVRDTNTQKEIFSLWNTILEIGKRYFCHDQHSIYFMNKDELLD